MARTMSQMPSLGGSVVCRTNSLPVQHRMPSAQSLLMQHQKSVPPTAMKKQSPERLPNDVASSSWLFQPGDLLCVKGSADNITSIGANGGFMGHVMLVTSEPRVIRYDTEEAIEYGNLWPRVGGESASVLFIIPSMESCRSEEGFYESEYLLYIDEVDRIRLLGERRPEGLQRFERADKVIVFHGPPALRKNIKPYLMEESLEAMRDSRQGSWSWGTAIRAYLFSADIEENAWSSRDAALEDIQQCWKADPICTSLIIIFWQRYICALADEWNEMRWPHEPKKHAFDMICEWIPLKADRALPADMVNTLERCGWTSVSRASPPTLEARLRSYTM